MAYERDGSSNTAIFAIVALVLVGLLVFFLFFRNGDVAVEEQEPDVTLNVEPEGGEGSEGDNAQPLFEGGDLDQPAPEEEN